MRDKPTLLFVFDRGKREAGLACPCHLNKMLDRDSGLGIGRRSGMDECFNNGPDMLALVDDVAGQ